MRLQEDKGFNIAEVMVAFGILSIGMAGVITMLIQSMQSDTSSVRMRQGDEVAALVNEMAKGADGDFAATQSSSLSGTYYRLDMTLTSLLSFSSATSAVNRIDVVVGWGGDDPNRDGCSGGNCSEATPECCKYVSRFWNYVAK